MTMRTLLCLAFAALTAASAFAADALPVFNGTLTVGKETRFLLIGPEGAGRSWLKLGDTFGGYALKTYDAKSSTLELEKGGKISRVSLAADASVADGAAAKMTPATIEDATALLDQMHFESMLDRTMVGVKRQQLALLDRMTGQMKNSGVDREEFMEFQKKIMDEMMSAISGAEMKGDVARLYSEIFTKEELEGMGNFYVTPLGKALAEKQPVLAEKMNELMVPRIMAALPKVQKMAQEFAIQQKAKAAAAQEKSASATPPPPAD